VEFAVRPLQRNDAVAQRCAAPVADRRWVTTSGGHREKRYVINASIRVADHAWPIEMSLTNRDEMGFRLLIGRTAMLGRLIVDPASSYRTGKPKKKRAAKEPSHHKTKQEKRDNEDRHACPESESVLPQTPCGSG
jgi:hypothetical protein